MADSAFLDRLGRKRRKLLWVLFGGGAAYLLALRLSPYLTTAEAGDNRASRVARKVGPRLGKALRPLNAKLGSPVFLRVFKESDELELWVRPSGQKAFALFRTYRIAKWSGHLGPKLQEGDRQAPEGFYHVPKSAMNPRSRFHLSFNLGYPNAYEKSLGRTGSFLMIHGSDKSIGCFAMTDAKIEEIYTLCDTALDAGQPYFRVHCFPFRMTKKRLDQEKGKKWHPFWMNLKEGYDWFEEKKVPPDVFHRNGKYRFRAS